MRSLALLATVLIPLSAHGGYYVATSPRTRTQTEHSIKIQSCGDGYACQAVHAQLCVKKPMGHNLWSISRRDVHLRRSTSVSDCTAYAVTVTFSLRYNGRQAGVQKRSLRCAVQVQHGVSVAIETCYSLVQKNAQQRFSDMVSGARVCVRTLGARGRGCHQDFAINIYTRANGHLAGETWLGSKVYVPSL